MCAPADSTEVPNLETVWYEPDPTQLQCLVCSEPFGHSAVVRTYRVGRAECEDPSSLGCSAIVRTHLGREKDILLYDRHLDCIIREKLAFTAVSHVWDPDVSLTQMRKRHSPQSAAARRRTIESPVHIYEGLRQDRRDEDGEEMWHDYLSVPQWTGDVKTNILGSIHTIFSTATTTLFYFHDLRDDAVRKLRYGESSEERLEGMTAVCNALWFGRTWTAMEFVRTSGRVRMMTTDYKPVGCPDDPVFLGRLYEVWEQELEKHETVYDLERKVNIGHSLVPWNLGTLAQVRALGKTNFAMAFALLSKRECRDESDFLYALSGIVLAIPQLPFRNDVRSEIANLARGCIETGDYSPLLMMPDLGDIDPRASPDYAFNTGYNDVATWELGEQISNPAFADEISFSDNHQIVKLRLEKMGRVMTVRQANGGAATGEALRNFARCAAFALELTGPNVDEFVSSVTTRLYGLDHQIIMERLVATGNIKAVQEALRVRFNDPARHHGKWPIEGPQGAEWLAEVLSLSNPTNGEHESRLAACLSRFNTMHCRWFNHLVAITCPGCLRTSPFRVGAFGPSQATLHGANAYRIPGLQYRQSIPNGMALMEKNGRIVGRMMWAAPACSCVQTQLVQLHFPILPPPRPRSRFLSKDARPAYEVYLGDVDNLAHEVQVNDEAG
ncbi:hypothetical protein V8F20_011322 [Naviculisporaceae sp. PSN 640]